MSLRSKTFAIFLVKFGLSAGVLYFVLRGLDLENLRAHFVATNPLIFIGAVALVVVQTFFLNLRWMLVMNASDAPMPFLSGLRILLASMWFNQVLPSSLGADAVRIWFLLRKKVPKSSAVGGVLADRISGLLALVLLIIVTFPILVARIDQKLAIISIGSLAALGLFGVAVLITLDKWPHKLVRVWPISSIASIGALLRYLIFRFPRRVAVMGVGVTIHLISTAICLLLAYGIGANLGVIDALILIPPVILLSALPISLSGWGVREGAMVAGLSLVGVANTAALAVSLQLGFATLLVGVAGGAVWLLSGDRHQFRTSDLQLAGAVAPRSRA